MNRASLRNSKAAISVSSITVSSFLLDFLAGSHADHFANQPRSRSLLTTTILQHRIRRFQHDACRKATSHTPYYHPASCQCSKCSESSSAHTIGKTNPPLSCRGKPAGAPSHRKIKLRATAALTCDSPPVPHSSLQSTPLRTD